MLRILFMHYNIKPFDLSNKQQNIFSLKTNRCRLIKI